MKLFTLLCVLVLYTSVISGEDKDDNMTEQTTELPLAEMGLSGDAVKAENEKVDSEPIKQHPGDAEPHTIADFIIHPLIALKPRLPEAGNVKQTADTATPASPWQFFGFNPGQGLGSSVSSLAGTVTGWLGNRIQLPGLVDTPVHEPTTTTTTTVRPDLIIKIQRPSNTKKPTNTISNKNEPPFRRYNRPNRFNVVTYAEDSEESDDSSEYNDYTNFAIKRINRRRYQNYQDDNDDDDDEQVTEEQQEDDDESHNNPKRRFMPVTVYKRRNSFSPRSQLKLNQGQETQGESSEEEQYEDEAQDSDFRSIPEMKRSQHELNFIQRSQQNLLKQITQYTGGEATGEEGRSTLTKTQKSKKHAPSAAVLVKRNGQRVYVAPERLQMPQISHTRDTQGSSNKLLSNRYPQTPASITLKRKSQPTHYIAIPWNQLGVFRSKQSAGLASSGQPQPLILTIPPDAVEKIHKLGNQKKTPALTTKPELVLKSSRIVPGRPVGEKLTTPQRNKQDNENSSESLENDDPSTPYIVIADEAPNTRTLSGSDYRQVLDYFNRNRLARQLNDQDASSIDSIAADTKEQLIPVQIITETEDNKATELKATTESATAIEIPQIASESDDLIKN